LSGFVKDLAAEELRTRHGNSYSVGQNFLGTVANPLNFVLGINTGPPVNLVVTKWIVSASAPTQFTLFQSTTNPTLTAGNTPFARFLGSAQPNNAVFQVAVAAAPVVNATLAAGQLGAGIPLNLCAGDVYIIDQGQWLILQIPALAVTVGVAISWYNLTD